MLVYTFLCAYMVLFLLQLYTQEWITVFDVRMSAHPCESGPCWHQHLINSPFLLVIFRSQSRLHQSQLLFIFYSTNLVFFRLQPPNKNLLVQGWFLVLVFASSSMHQESCIVRDKYTVQFGLYRIKMQKKENATIITSTYESSYGDPSKILYGTNKEITGGQVRHIISMC